MDLSTLVIHQKVILLDDRKNVKLIIVMWFEFVYSVVIRL